MPKRDYEEVQLTIRIIKPIPLTEMDLRKGVAMALKSLYNQGSVDSKIRHVRYPAVIGYKRIGFHSGKE